jgi:PIN domain nuclease of toxin-antitoxin system
MILLDTHVLVWLVADPNRLSRPAASAIRRARSGDGLAIADIVIYELAFLVVRGSIRAQYTVARTIDNFVLRSGVIVKPITPEIAAIASQFSGDYPKDPADRLIGATAMAEGLPLVTRDDRIRSCPLVKTIW